MSVHKPKIPPSRDDFPQVLNNLGLLGIAVEVGVHRGTFSSHILSNWTGQRLYSVDSWTFQPEVKLDKSNVSNDEHERCFKETRQKLRVFKDRSIILREFSVQSSRNFKSDSLDFVYLDARHDYRSVTSDLVAWWPKVRQGGIIAGHDYFDKFFRKNLVEVKRAVDNFFRQVQDVYSTTDDNLPSWFVIKS